jgi:NAD(P)-dependent dehydrogenase (short-subunit alcohol dehydrogenase family)
MIDHPQPPVSQTGKLPEDAVANLGADEMSRQPAELATAYVMLADPLSSYVAGATIAVTGGKLIL